MARISGIDLQDNWKVAYALTNIKGVGWSRAEEVLEKSGIEPSLRVKDLSADDVSKLAAELENYKTEGDLLRDVRGNINRLRQIGAYRGIRHQRGLPAHGQRTKTNARTKRGKRKTVGAFRKDALTKQGPKE